jgi:hypothetical protein
MAQDRDQWRALADTAVSPQTPQKTRNFLTATLSRMTPVYAVVPVVNFALRRKDVRFNGGIAPRIPNLGATCRWWSASYISRFIPAESTPGIHWI